MTAARRRVALAGVVVTALTGVLGACGGETSPLDDVPALGERLDEVDAAVVDERYGEARRALTEMTTLTEGARESGDLDADEADEVLAAVREMLDALPEVATEPTGPTEPVTPDEPTSTPSDEPSEEPPLTIVPEDDGDEGDEEQSEEEKEAEKQREEEEKEREKEEKEREKDEKGDD